MASPNLIATPKPAPLMATSKSRELANKLPADDPWQYMQARKSLLQSEVELVNDRLQHYIDKKQNFELTASELQSVAELYELRQALQQELRDLVPHALTHAAAVLERPATLLMSRPVMPDKKEKEKEKEKEDDKVPDNPLLRVLQQLARDTDRLHDELTDAHVVFEAGMEVCVMPTPDITAKLVQRMRRFYRTTGDVVEQHMCGDYAATAQLQLQVLRKLRHGLQK